MNKNLQFFLYLAVIVFVLSACLWGLSFLTYDKPVGYHYVGPTPPPGNPITGIGEIYGEVRIYYHIDGSQTWERGYEREYKQR